MATAELRPADRFNPNKLAKQAVENKIAQLVIDNVPKSSIKWPIITNVKT